MKMQQLTCLIHVDALRPDYITEVDMPFLYRQGQQGVVTRVIPPFGFEPDGAYLTGTNPEQYQGGAHFVYRESRPPLPGTGWLPGWLDHLSPYLQYPLRRLLARIIKRQASTARIASNPGVAWVPFKLLPHFDFCEKYFVEEPGFAGENRTLFDICRATGQAWFYHGYPKYSPWARDVEQQLPKRLTGEESFMLVLLGDLDQAGHHHGPGSSEQKEAARLVDRAIERIYRRAAEVHDRIDLLAFGDHGMAPVDNYVDVQACLVKLPLTPGRDYFHFLDSTLARFWLLSDGAEPLIRERMNELPGLTLVTDKDRNHYGINFPSRKFGDLIYWVEDGWMIYPDFWHGRRPPVAMHGYRREVSDNHGAVIFHCTEENLGATLGSIEMADIFQTAAYSLTGQPYRGPGVVGIPLQAQVRLQGSPT